MEESNVKRSFLSLFAVAAFALPGIAFADQYTCSGFTTGLCAQQSGSSPLTQIDHHDIYTWGFNGISLAGKTVLSATIAFTQINNWDTNQNRLYIDLLDSPNSKNSVPSGGAVNSIQVDTNAGDVGIANWNDDFLHNNTNSVGANGGGDWRYSLTANGSAAKGLVAVGANDTPDHANDLGHAGTQDGTHSFAGPGSPVNYTYTFSATDLTTLASYINNGGDFAFGFSPDCHYFDTAVTMQISLGNASVPEPKSILLLGAVAFLLLRRIQRKRSIA